MRLPAQTPTVVRAALRRYLWVQRLMAMIATLAGGLALAAAIVWVGLVTDRYVELAPAWRAVGPWLAVAVVVVAVGLAAWFAGWYRLSPLAIAVRLDQAFPEQQDRFATTLDVAERLAAGEHPGAAACIDRLMAETARLTTGRQAGRVVRWRPAWRSLTALALVALAWAGLVACPVFHLPLLWQRFWHPHANLPRDSFVQITLVELNGAPPGDTTAWRLPEESPLTFTVAIADRRPGAAPVRQPPQLVFTDGTPPLELLRDGQHWLYREPRLTRPLSFRIRAGDGLSARYTLALEPRIRLDRVTHTVRFPRYARLPDLLDAPLTAKRLSLLSETRLELTVTCNVPFAELAATFEPLPRGATEAAAIDPLTDRRGTGAEEAHRPTQPRPLKLQRLSDEAGRFALRIEETGLLRVLATGHNGLASHPLVVVVEAAPDAPPRIALTEVEPDTTIMPGELVAFAYRAEDDLAVVDLILEWYTAGSATSGNLAGEEYLKAAQIGGKVVTGQELIQRMNYHVYATQPFEFRVVAVDSKGQEARTPMYRIHITEEDFGARFAQGMEFLRERAKDHQRFAQVFQQLTNQLNIVGAALGEQRSWPANQEKLAEELARIANQAGGYSVFRDPYLQRFGSFPLRLDRSAVLLVAAMRMLPLDTDLLPAIADLRASADVPAELARLRTRLEAGRELALLAAAAATAEVDRFGAEATLHRARKLEYRVRGLEAIRASAALHAANLAFYRQEATALHQTLAPRAEALPGLTERLAALQDALAGQAPAELATALVALVEFLARQQSPTSPGLDALCAHLGELAGRDAERRDRFAAALGDVLRGRGQEPLLPTGDILALRTWLVTANTPVPPAWHRLPMEPADAWLRLAAWRQQVRNFQRDLRVGRFELYPEARLDRESELREQALALGEAAPAWQSALAPFAEGGFAAWLATDPQQRLAALEQAWQAAAAQHVPQLEAPVSPALSDVQTVLRQVAAAYLELGQRIEAEVAARPLTADGLAALVPRWSGPAQRLQLRLEGAEALYRSAFMRRVAALTLGEQSAPAWPNWEPWHQMQIAMTGLAARAQDRIYGRTVAHPPSIKDPPAHAQAIAVQCRTMATDLAMYAELLAKLAAGQPLAHDFGALVQETRTTGHLPALQAEYDLVQPFLRRPPVPAEAAVIEPLREAKLGRVALRERSSQALTALQRDLASAPPPAQAVPLLRLGQTLAEELAEEPLQQALAQALQAAAAADTPEATWKRRLATVTEQLGLVQTQVAAAIRLPPVNTTQRENRRFTSGKGVDYLWTVAGFIQRYDRLWLEGLREAELDLVRELLVHAVPTPDQPASQRDLAIAYLHLVERRARNLAHEQQRNRGIAFLNQDNGPTLNLPRHIAQEFLKARGRQAPPHFRDRIESYFQNLYRDLAP